MRSSRCSVVHAVRAAIGFVAFALVGAPAIALPPNFVSTPIASGWNQAVGVAFAPPSAAPGADNRMFVWEKGGRVWNVENGVKGAAPLIDLSQEVGDWRDYGLLGFAVDPDFFTNGRIYLLYVVDFHHARWFGTPNYNPNTNEYFHDTIGRLTRYTCDPATGFRTVLPASRTVLIGESLSTGFPICHQSHGIGSLVFGADGTLLASCGDGASYDNVDSGQNQAGSSNTALADGIIRQAEAVGAFRAQLVDSLSGKVVRIDPATGDGVASNPWYDPANPRAARSRAWAMGLRNPYRMTRKPGTGSANPADGNPGTLYIGDVGWNAWEDIHVCAAPGANFGWPLYEGLESNTGYAVLNTVNRDAPNPLFGVGGCSQQFFRFRDLLVQDTLAQPSWPNPCDGAQQIPAGVRRHEHVRPIIDYFHNGAGPARTGTYSGVNATVASVGAPGSPVTGAPFGGFTSVAGAWYTGTSYPAEYQGRYFHADYAAGWVRALTIDANDRPTAVGAFDNSLGAVVCIAADPVSGDLHYINYDDLGASTVRRLSYVQNLPPVVSADAAPRYGAYPLQVSFSSAGTFDPEGQALTYRWDFDDMTAVSGAPNPTHTYTPNEDITAQGTFVARVLSFNPPNPTGGGNPNPAILRDGDYPPVGNQDSARQYDTFHNNAQGTGIDWVGWSFPQSRQFTGLIFQEGKHFGDGGWFDSIGVQTRTGAGAWLDVQGLSFTPAYAGNNGAALSYETFAVAFTPVTGTDIRVVGNPGGSANFISVGELRVLAAPLTPPIGPQRYDATLTVTDTLGAFATKTLVISPNNTPPQVEIVTPVSGSTYPHDKSSVVPMAAMVTDAEHGPGQLTCSWEVVLHHNAHTHPEPPDPNCSSSAVVTPHGGAPGDTFYYEFRLTVTDAHGLAGTDTAYIFTEAACAGDVNGDASVTFADLNVILATFGQTGIALPGDLNHNFVVDFADLNIVLGAFGSVCAPMGAG